MGIQEISVNNFEQEVINKYVSFIEIFKIQMCSLTSSEHKSLEKNTGMRYGLFSREYFRVKFRIFLMI